MTPALGDSIVAGDVLSRCHEHSLHVTGGNILQVLLFVACLRVGINAHSLVYQKPPVSYDNCVSVPISRLLTVGSTPV